ncbi:MAG: Fe-S cluster assembly protein SufD [Acidimicrobiia bacterium]
MSSALAVAMPTVEEEIWRYSRIGELDLSTFEPAPVPWATSSTEIAVAGGESDIGVAMSTPADVFAELNAQHCGRPIVVRTKRGQVIETPVVIDHHLTVDGSAVFPRLVIDAADDSEITVVQRFTSDDIRAFVAPVVELRAAVSARVKFLVVNDLGTKVWHIGSLAAAGDRDSSTTLAAVSLGGDYARQRIDARLDGQGASGEQIAVYFGEGDQLHDFRTLQDHNAPKTTSSLLFKGALEDRAKSVYTGLIKVRPHAKGSVAYQTNRNIKLSDATWAESVPNLEIETNDVRCSHASAVGPIDEDQRFYLESRGVPTRIAERLIVIGFFDEVFERLPAQALVAPLRARVAAKLERISQ